MEAVQELLVFNLMQTWVFGTLSLLKHYRKILILLAHVASTTLGKCPLLLAVLLVVRVTVFGCAEHQLCMIGCTREGKEID